MILEMIASKWPPGSYAVPMVLDGCPEDNGRGWEIGRIRITTMYPMTTKDSYKSCNEDPYKYQTDETLQYNNSFAAFAGYFDKYELLINLCYKLPQYTSDVDIDWPTGNYSIYGVNNKCPPGKCFINVSIYCFKHLR